VSDAVVYFSNSNGYLYAIDGNARNWLWENELRPYWVILYFYRSAPLPPPKSGFLWGFNLGERTVSSPAMTEGILYISSGSRLFSIDIESHEKRWVFEDRDEITSSPAIVDTTIYVGSEDGHLYALDATTGNKLWDIRTGDKITSSAAVANATVYIGSHNGNLYAIK